MIVQQLLQSLLTQQRHVAAEQQQRSGKIDQSFPSAQQSMAGAELLFLHGKIDLLTG